MKQRIISSRNTAEGPLEQDCEVRKCHLILIKKSHNHSKPIC